MNILEELRTLRIETTLRFIEIAKLYDGKDEQDFSALLRFATKILQVSSSDIAKYLNVNRTTVVRWIAGDTYSRKEVIDHLVINLEYILEEGV